MRSTNEIRIAVSECEPCTDTELRLCIAAMGGQLHFAINASDRMSEAIESDNKVQRLCRAGFWRDGAERRFQSNKMPVDKYLGPGNIPGSPEQVERLKVGKAIVKKATGMEL